MKYLLAVPMTFFIFDFIFLLIFKPYLNKRHNLRQIFNTAVGILIMSIYIFIQNASLEFALSSTKPMILSMVVLVLLLFVIIVNLVAIIYEFSLMYKKWKYENEI